MGNWWHRDCDFCGRKHAGLSGHVKLVEYPGGAVLFRFAWTRGSSLEREGIKWANTRVEYPDGFIDEQCVEGMAVDLSGLMPMLGYPGYQKPPTMAERFGRA